MLGQELTVLINICTTIVNCEIKGNEGTLPTTITILNAQRLELMANTSI